MTGDPWTPGPWRAHTEADYDRLVVDGPTGQPLVHVLTLSREWGAPIANARLIAAAPEMTAFIAMLAREPFASSPSTRAEARNLLVRIRGDA